MSAGWDYYDDPRPDIRALVDPRGLRCLDVGCAGGAFAASLKAAGAAHVAGVEYEPAAAARARERLDVVVEGSILDADLPFAAASSTSSCSPTCSSTCPIRTRRSSAACRCWPTADGSSSSVPNMRFWLVLLRLAADRWEYADHGIRDRTHLRIFTRRSLLAMLARHGLEPEVLRRNHRLLDDQSQIGRAGALATRRGRRDARRASRFATCSPTSTSSSRGELGERAHAARRPRRSRRRGRLHADARRPPARRRRVRAHGRVSPGRARAFAAGARRRSLLNRLVHPIAIPDMGFRALSLRQRFDLVHVHAHPVSLRGLRGAPLVMSEGSSAAVYVGEYLGWDDDRLGARAAPDAADLPRARDRRPAARARAHRGGIRLLGLGAGDQPAVGRRSRRSSRSSRRAFRRRRPSTGRRTRASRSSSSAATSSARAASSSSRRSRRPSASDPSCGSSSPDPTRPRATPTGSSTSGCRPRVGHGASTRSRRSSATARCAGCRGCRASSCCARCTRAPTRSRCRRTRRDSASRTSRRCRSDCRSSRRPSARPARSSPTDGPGLLVAPGDVGRPARCAAAPRGRPRTGARMGAAGAPDVPRALHDRALPGALGAFYRTGAGGGMMPPRAARRLLLPAARRHRAACGRSGTRATCPSTAGSRPCSRRAHGAYYRDPELPLPGGPRRAHGLARAQQARASALLRTGGDDRTSRRASPARARCGGRRARGGLLPRRAGRLVPRSRCAPAGGRSRAPADAILSSSFPITAHLVGAAPAPEAGVPWVAEFRDPWSEMLAPGLGAARAARLERSLARDAAAVVMTSPSWASACTRGCGVARSTSSPTATTSQLRAVPAGAGVRPRLPRDVLPGAAGIARARVGGGPHGADGEPSAGRPRSASSATSIRRCAAQLAAHGLPTSSV